MFTHKIGVCDVKLWESADISKLEHDLEALNKRIAMLEDVIEKLGDKAKPVDLSTMAPGQCVRLRAGGAMRFIAIDEFRSDFPFLFRFLNSDDYFPCDIYGNSGYSTDYDIVEILPLQAKSEVQNV